MSSSRSPTVPAEGLAERPARDPRSIGIAAIDGCVFHEWPGPHALAPYLPEGWRRMLMRDGNPINPGSIWRYTHPRGEQDVAALPASGPPGSDLGLLVAQTLGGGLRERVVLGYHDGLLATAFPQPRLARALVRAANDWTVDQWLARDERLHGMVLVMSALPEEAAAEIRRVGSHPRMVAVALGTNGLGRHFGHPVYRPIHAAAAELGLPLVVQSGCDSATDQVTVPTAVGLPATYAEYDIHSAQPLMAHAASFVLEGVFDEFPGLRVLLAGGGAAWVPWCLWNMDYLFRMVRRGETPWLQAPPSEYFARHIRLGTRSLESPRDPTALGRVLGTIPGAERMLVYTSAYPAWDWEEPGTVAARLPEEWHAGVFRDNALDLFRWEVP
jgi:uncharacterized protein